MSSKIGVRKQEENFAQKYSSFSKGKTAGMAAALYFERYFRAMLYTNLMFIVIIL